MSQVSTGIMTVMVLALAAYGCTKTSFSGGNGKKEAEPKTSSGETTLPPGNGDAQPAPEESPGQPPSNTTTTPEQTQEQRVVTTDIQSAVRYEDDFTGGIASAAKPVDIIIAVDTSGSMKDEALRVQSQLSDLVDSILSAKENIDFHIWLIGTVNLEQLTDEQKDKVTQLKTTVSSTNSLQILSAFLKGQLTSMLNANIPKIRTNSQKELLVITDDNAAANSVPLFEDTIASRADLTGSTSLNGFVWLPTS